MKKPLRLLLVEDSDDDAALILRELRRGGFEPACERVDTGPAFRTKLREARWDLVISDFTLPAYDGLSALDDLSASGLDLPFILVSGSIGEAVAVEAMRRGARDYVLKNQLTRLPAAVERELGEARARAERQRMREQLVISERMASAGLLAAGVAHEINNPLAVLFANIEGVTTTLSRLVPEARALEHRAAREASGDGGGVGWTGWLESRLSDTEEELRDAREAIVRIRDIVRDVKLFSRPDDQKRGAVDVRRAIESALRMSWNEIRHRARLVKDFGDVPRVEANEGQLGQVLLNLIVNAAQAIPEGNAEGNEIRVTTRSVGADVQIEIRDTGAGILRENLEKIFDPFFTTKPIGVGTGLGLSICYRIVTEFGGTIGVESEVGKGTAFRVTLRGTTVEDSLSMSLSMPPVDAHAPAAPVRRARVLVVDDEVAVVRAVKRGLGVHHDLVCLTSGAEAVARIAAGERFDVILSDLMMPDVTGMDMHERLVGIAPDQAARMIFLSGGAFTARARTFLDTVPNARIEKPFTVPNLLAIIAGVLR